MCRIVVVVALVVALVVDVVVVVFALLCTGGIMIPPILTSPL